jgi:hypothetical protein
MVGASGNGARERRATMPNTETFLRRVLLADAAASLAIGAMGALGAGALAGLLGLPVPLLRGAGLVLLPWAALVAWLAYRPAMPRRAVWAVLMLNVIWVVDSLLLLISGLVAPTALGTTFVLAQAAAVAALATAQGVGLRVASAPQMA